MSCLSFCDFFFPLKPKKKGKILIQIFVLNLFANKLVREIYYGILNIFIINFYNNTYSIL